MTTDQKVSGLNPDGVTKRVFQPKDLYFFMHYAYILYAAGLNRYCIGSTSVSLQERLEKHLYNRKGFTAKAKDWQLVYSEQFSTIGEARQRELQLKKWKSAKRIAELISRSSPEFRTFRSG